MDKFSHVGQGVKVIAAEHPCCGFEGRVKNIAVSNPAYGMVRINDAHAIPDASRVSPDPKDPRHQCVELRASECEELPILDAESKAAKLNAAA